MLTQSPQNFLSGRRCSLREGSLQKTLPKDTCLLSISLFNNFRMNELRLIGLNSIAFPKRACSTVGMITTLASQQLRIIVYATARQALSSLQKGIASTLLLFCRNAGWISSLAGALSGSKVLVAHLSLSRKTIFMAFAQSYLLAIGTGDARRASLPASGKCADISFFRTTFAASAIYL